jgi:hypothetical protein
MAWFGLVTKAEEVAEAPVPVVGEYRMQLPLVL